MKLGNTTKKAVAGVALLGLFAMAGCTAASPGSTAGGDDANETVAIDPVLVSSGGPLSDDYSVQIDNKSLHDMDNLKMTFSMGEYVDSDGAKHSLTSDDVAIDGLKATFTLEKAILNTEQTAANFIDAVGNSPDASTVITTYDANTHGNNPDALYVYGCFEIDAPNYEVADGKPATIDLCAGMGQSGSHNNWWIGGKDFIRDGSSEYWEDRTCVNNPAMHDKDDLRTASFCLTGAEGAYKFNAVEFDKNIDDNYVAFVAPAIHLTVGDVVKLSGETWEEIDAALAGVITPIVVAECHNLTLLEDLTKLEVDAAKREVDKWVNKALTAEESAIETHLENNGMGVIKAKLIARMLYGVEDDVLEGVSNALVDTLDLFAGYCAAQKDDDTAAVVFNIVRDAVKIVLEQHTFAAESLFHAPASYTFECPDNGNCASLNTHSKTQDQAFTGVQSTGDIVKKTDFLNNVLEAINEPATTLTLNATASRYQSDTPVKWLEAKLDEGTTMSDSYILAGGTDDVTSPSHLNFAYCGELTPHNGTLSAIAKSAPVCIGQGSDTYENDWWVGGAGWKKIDTFQIDISTEIDEIEQVVAVVSIEAHLKVLGALLDGVLESANLKEITVRVAYHEASGYFLVTATDGSIAGEVVDKYFFIASV